jgi:FkbM family methyltransferase
MGFNFMKRVLRTALRRVGYEIHAFNHLRNHELRKKKLIDAVGINLIVDAGANVGQFAEKIRGLGYLGRIVSLEPIADLFLKLTAKAKDPRFWEAHNLALGERDGEAEFNVCVIPEVSSFLTATGAATTGEWTATTRQTVRVRALDSLLPELKRADDRIYLKLDIQGYERYALAGAEQALEEVLALELEASSIPLYEGEWLLPEMIHHLSHKGFRVFSIDPVLVDHVSGEVLQFEVLFARNRGTNSGLHAPK